MMDYWASTQRQLWCLDPLALAMAELPDLEHVSPAELRHVRIFYALFIQNIGKRCQLRQECIATAIVYFRRFYARNNLCDSDPTLTAVTSVYVASKVSEMPMHLSQLCSESKSAALEKGLPFPYDVTNIVEFEFYLLEELEFCLIVYLPYQTLLEVANATRLDKQIMQQTWWIINNSFTSDVCLVHPPHMIALAALMIACGAAAPPVATAASVPPVGTSIHRSTSASGAADSASPEIMSNPTTPATAFTANASATASNALEVSTSLDSEPIGSAAYMRNWFMRLEVDASAIVTVAQQLLYIYSFGEPPSDSQIHVILKRLCSEMYK